MSRENIIVERWKDKIDPERAEAVENMTARAMERDGAAILAFLMPVFVDVMMDNPGVDWGRPFYPVVE